MKGLDGHLFLNVAEAFLDTTSRQDNDPKLLKRAQQALNLHTFGVQAEASSSRQLLQSAVASASQDSSGTEWT